MRKATNAARDDDVFALCVSESSAPADFIAALRAERRAVQLDGPGAVPAFWRATPGSYEAWRHYDESAGP